MILSWEPNSAVLLTPCLGIQHKSIDGSHSLPRSHATRSATHKQVPLFLSPFPIIRTGTRPFQSYPRFHPCLSQSIRGHLPINLGTQATIRPVATSFFPQRVLMSQLISIWR